MQVPHADGTSFNEKEFAMRGENFVRGRSTRKAVSSLGRLTAASLLLAGVVVPATQAASTPALTVLHTFGSQVNDGGGPESSLTIGSDGKLYGTTSLGGVFNGGSVFTVSADGTEA